MIEAVHMVQKRDLANPILKDCKVLICSPRLTIEEIRDAGIQGMLYAPINLHMMPLHSDPIFHDPFHEVMDKPKFFYADQSQPDGRLRATSYDMPEFRLTLRLYETLGEVTARLLGHWQGIYIDDCTEWIPPNRLEKIKPYWANEISTIQARWEACRGVFLRTLHAHGAWNILANTAGWTSPLLQGITIERPHIEQNGILWAAARFVEQGGHANIVWDYPGLASILPGIAVLNGATRRGWA